MKKTKLLTVALSLLFITAITQDTNAQFGKLKNTVNKATSGGKSSSKGGGGKGSFAELNNETDEFGITGQYFDLASDSYGFKFVKEAEGKLVNQLYYWEKKADKPQAKFEMRENFFRKNQVKIFYYWVDGSSSGYVEFIELDPGVFAQVSTNWGYGNGGPVDITAPRTVIDVRVKDKALLSTWDLETAKAKTEMILATLKGEAGDKTKKSLMKFESYGNYVGKIAFAKATNVLRNQKYNEPVEKVSNFITKAELGNTVAWKPYFEQPLEVSHPGAWFNITYEMAGVTTDREVLRKSSTVFSKNIPQMEDDKDKFYFYFPRVLVDASNNVADYAFLELLRKTQDQLKEGQTYDLKVTVWAFKDGANIAPVATGMVQLEYVAGEKGSKPNLYAPTDGWITIIEKLLD